MFVKALFVVTNVFTFFAYIRSEDVNLTLVKILLEIITVEIVSRRNAGETVNAELVTETESKVTFDEVPMLNKADFVGSRAVAPALELSI